MDISLKQTKYLKYRFDQILGLLSESKNVSFSVPLDKSLHSFFQEHKKFGSTDRTFISECLFFYTRHKTYIDTYSSLINAQDPYCPLFISYLLLLEDPSRIFDKIYKDSLSFISSSTLSGIQQHLTDIISFKFSDSKLNRDEILYSMPGWIVEKLKLAYKDYPKLLYALLKRASTTIRVNSIKTTKEKLLSLLDKKNIHYRLLDQGIALSSKVHLESLKEYREGLFEVQDESSQIICSKIDLKDSTTLVDYCSGAGGKSLNLASKFNQTKFYCHDIRAGALAQLEKRAARSCASNIKIIKNHKKLPVSDVLLMDLPCSGMGTLRRSPWIKWSLTQEKLDQIISLQLSIVDEAISQVKPRQKIYYITCSILREENEDNTVRILEKYPNLSLIQEIKTNPVILPDTDGMYMAEFKVSESWG